MTDAACSPFAAEIETLSAAPGEIRTAMDVDRDELILAGHYPSFPIFPGVCLIEFAHRSARRAAPQDAGPLELQGVERARFLSPVYPGDHVEAELSWMLKDGAWRCSAAISTTRGGKAAQVRLRYGTAVAR